jgi:hypothetical protein
MKTKGWLSSPKLGEALFTIILVVLWSACVDETQQLSGPGADAASTKGKSAENTNYLPALETTDGYTWTITIDQTGKKSISHLILQEITGCDRAFLSISDIESVEEIMPNGMVPPDGYSGLEVVDSEGRGTGCIVANGYFVKIQNFVNKNGVLVLSLTFNSKVTQLSMLLKAGTFCSDSFVSEEVKCTECEKEETAWGAGIDYPDPCSGNGGGGWATYSTYVEGGSVTLYAGQTYNAGTARFSSDGSNVIITITLNSGFVLKSNTSEPIKIQPYASEPTCSDQPRPGQFDIKTYSDLGGGVYKITIPGVHANYYGIHLDVLRPVECPTGN